MEEEIKALLGKPLNPKSISQRTGGGNTTLDYLEGWFVIAEANRIFGFDGWNMETVRLEHIGEGKTANGKATVAYYATVRVTVDDVTRDGTGYGNGIDKNVINAHELAVKEAETDAMKRAFKSFGNPFGLALYDKQKAGVGVDPQEALRQFALSVKKKVATITDKDAFVKAIAATKKHERYITSVDYPEIKAIMDKAFEQKEAQFKDTSSELADVMDELESEVGYE